LKTLVNLLVDPDSKSSHILLASGRRACHCRVSKQSTVSEGVDLSVPSPEHHWNVCEESWKRLRKELGRLDKWNNVNVPTERKPQ
jgi:hypothetical protein